MGETDDEVDRRRWPTCAAVGVDIVTIGQYLRPTTHHLPVARWVDARASSTRCAEVGRGARHRPRRGQPAHPVELPRPPGARRRSRRAAHRRARWSAIAHRLSSRRPDWAHGQDARRRSTPTSSAGSSASTCSSWPRAPIERRRARQPVAEGLRHASACSTPAPVAYLDLTGAAPRPSPTCARTAASRCMFCAFEGPPQIVRLYGRGEVAGARRRATSTSCVAAVPGPARAARSVIVVGLDRVATSCGYSVPAHGLRGGARRRSTSGPSARAPTASPPTGPRRTPFSIDGLPGPRRHSAGCLGPVRARPAAPVARRARRWPSAGVDVAAAVGRRPTCPG